MAELKGAKGVLKQAYKDAKKKKRTAKKARKYEKSDQFRGPRDPRSMKIKKKNLPEAMGGKIKFQKVPEIDAVEKMDKKPKSTTIKLLQGYMKVRNRLRPKATDKDVD